MALQQRHFESADAVQAEFDFAKNGEGRLQFQKEESIRIARKQQRIYSNQFHDSEWSVYNLTQLPGCCGVVVSHGSWLDPNKRGIGLGEYFHKERLNLAEYLGYSCMVATTTDQNKAEQHILEKNGWKKVHTFENYRTGNVVQIWIKDI